MVGMTYDPMERARETARALEGPEMVTTVLRKRAAGVIRDLLGDVAKANRQHEEEAGAHQPERDDKDAIIRSLHRTLRPYDVAIIGPGPWPPEQVSAVLDRTVLHPLVLVHDRAETHEIVHRVCAERGMDAPSMLWAAPVTVRPERRLLRWRRVYS